MRAFVLQDVKFDEFYSNLVVLSTCPESRLWVGNYRHSLGSAFYAEDARPDWAIWYLVANTMQRGYPDGMTIKFILCDCVLNALNALEQHLNVDRSRDFVLFVRAMIGMRENEMAYGEYRRVLNHMFVPGLVPGLRELKDYVLYEHGVNPSYAHSVLAMVPKVNDSREINQAMMAVLRQYVAILTTGDTLPGSGGHHEGQPIPAQLETDQPGRETPGRE